MTDLVGGLIYDELVWTSLAKCDPTRGSECRL